MKLTSSYLVVSLVVLVIYNQKTKQIPAKYVAFVHSGQCHHRHKSYSIYTSNLKLPMMHFLLIVEGVYMRM